MAKEKTFTQADVDAAVQAAIEAGRWKLPNLNKYKGAAVFLWLVLLTLFVLLLSFRSAPPSTVATGPCADLSNWTARTAGQLTPSPHLSDVKAIFQAAYLETVEKIKANELKATSDARLAVSQAIQEKIRSLNRDPPNQAELVTASQPLSDALGKRISDDVESGKFRDTLDDTERIFTAIAQGLK